MTKRRLSWKSLLHLPLLIFAGFCLLPLYWMLSTSLKERSAIFALPLQWIPDPWTLDNYYRLFSQLPFARQFFNTLLVCVVIVLGQLLFSSMGAYAFSRLRFPGRDTLFLAFLATMMIPGVVTLIPSFVLVRQFGWINTYWALIGPYVLGSAFATFLLRQFMQGIATELEEAARLDGASHFVIFTRIILPLVRPALAVVALFSFVAFWNEFQWPLIVINSEEMKTLTVGIASVAQSAYDKDWGVLMAGSVLTVLPLVVVFFFAQRQLVEGVTMTGLKG